MELRSTCIHQAHFIPSDLVMEISYYIEEQDYKFTNIGTSRLWDSNEYISSLDLSTLYSKTQEW